MEKLGPDDIIAMTRVNFSTSAAIENCLSGSTSAFTRCVCEVQQGNVDICVGNFWETPERGQISSFTSFYGLDTMVVLSKKKGSTTFGAKQLFGVFDPFTGEVWLVTGAMFVLGALLMHIIESGRSEDFEDDEHFPSPKGFAKSFRMSLIGYVSGGPAHSITSWPARFVMLGYGFFIYISVSSYTANLASFMVARGDDPTMVTSISDLIFKNENLCSEQALVGSVLGTFPRVPEDNIVKMNGHERSLLTLFEEKWCSAAVMGRDRYLELVVSQALRATHCPSDIEGPGKKTCSEENQDKLVEYVSPFINRTSTDPDFCDIVLIPETEWDLSIGLAWPISNDLQEKVSAWLVDMRLSGEVAAKHKQYVTDVYKPVCGASELASNAEDGALGLESMAGTYFVGGSFMFIGVVLHFAQVFMSRRGKGIESADIQEGKDQSSLEPTFGTKKAINDKAGSHDLENPKAGSNTDMAQLLEKQSMTEERLEGRLQEMARVQEEMKELIKQLVVSSNGSGGNHESGNNDAFLGFLKLP